VDGAAGDYRVLIEPAGHLPGAFRRAGIGRVFDRIPEPPAAPAEFVIRPRGTEHDTNSQKYPVLLAITAFSLSLLGTFLVRSGVLVSVHSFASDPTA
jgi:hypothetical protein